MARFREKLRIRNRGRANNDKPEKVSVTVGLWGCLAMGQYKNMDYLEIKIGGESERNNETILHFC
jgi:hypothetical protein